MNKLRPILGLIVGYMVALLSRGFLPLPVVLILPVVGIAVGLNYNRKANKPQQEKALPGPAEEPRPLPKRARPETVPLRNPNREQTPSAEIIPESQRYGPEYQPVLEYLDVLEDMIISEGQKHNLDAEIVEKCCALFLRIQRIIPLISELNNDEINHTVKRLVLKELNGVINPFLRLSGEAKIKNRRILLTGLKDVNTKITEIVSTVEHKDLLELQSKADLIHSRYGGNSF
ncbi:MAG: hypothetical protein P0Y55_03045 [Candidatus Cohnella colombiensis]|uniref:Uncharacterized protein n=1 Tax=Candidatus Cohnella colombiensis TaxID=3121368 RepID=A0AA95JG89_9BACL|nr:MAG: hypothetical protein P0Y55_03045 [Cohnella sp.]